MKKVCIIGHFGKGENLLNGQTIKTKIIEKELKDHFNEEEISCIDTHGGFKVLIKVIIQSIESLKYCQNIIILPGENGLRIFVPLLVIFNKLFYRKLHYVVIGGWLSKFIINKKFLSYFLKKFNYIYVETYTMKKDLEKMGFHNVLVVPNCKELKILKKEELIYNKKEPLKLCTFSRVMKEKGIEEAINAVKNVNTLENRVVFSLDIYGQIDKNQFDWFEKLKKDFPGYINYYGMIPYDKSTDVLKEYYALLFPTYYEGEGFAGTIIDAFAAGVPVVASDWKYNKEIISNWKTGIVTKNSLVAELIHILEYKDKWEKMKLECIMEAYKYLPEIALRPLFEKLR